MDPRQDQPNDEGARLMLAYQAGDEAAFDRIVERYSGQVYALLTRFLGPRGDREDLVQEVFLRVIRARGRYVAAARFSTWLYRIAFNLSANERQRPGRGVSIDRGASGDERFEIEDEAQPDPADGLEQEDAVSAVRAAIAELPANQRMALILSRYEELPHAEIARVLETSEKAIKSMLHRARENLRESLRPFLLEELA